MEVLLLWLARLRTGQKEPLRLLSCLLGARGTGHPVTGSVRGLGCRPIVHPMIARARRARGDNPPEGRACRTLRQFRVRKCQDEQRGRDLRRVDSERTTLAALVCYDV